MKQSENIAALAEALAKAQGEIEPAAFDRVNPHFKSKYATLTSIMESVKKPLAKNGLSIVQSLVGPREAMAVVTTVVHSSGQWLSDDGIPLILDKNNMQGLGSAISYAKRYGISALLSVVSDEDDDAEAAVGRNSNGEMAVKSVAKVETAAPVTAKKVQAKPAAKSEGDFI